MKRILIRRPGGYEALQCVSEPDCAVGPRQARVKVKAVGVNFADVMVRMGHYEAAKGLYPMTPGFEFCGVVESLGPGTSRVKPGDRVLGITRFGGYASRISVDERQLWPCPEDWSDAEGAAFPAVYLTAYYGLFHAAKVVAGETVLVHSAAGGVGTALLQLCRIAECRSIAVVGSGRKRALCRELGAAEVIDRSKEDLWSRARHLSPGGYDVVFDANGVSTLRPGFDSLALGGRLIVYGFAEIFQKGSASNWIHAAVNYLRVPKFSPLEMTLANRSVGGFNVIALFHKLEIADTALKRLLGWIAEGRLHKVPVTVYPLEQAAEAHRAIESGSTMGKLVLTISDD